MDTLPHELVAIILCESANFRAAHVSKLFRHILIPYYTKQLEALVRKRHPSGKHYGWMLRSDYPVFMWYEIISRGIKRYKDIFLLFEVHESSVMAMSRYTNSEYKYIANGRKRMVTYYAVKKHMNDVEKFIAETYINGLDDTVRVSPQDCLTEKMDNILCTGLFKYDAPRGILMTTTFMTIGDELIGLCCLNDKGQLMWPARNKYNLLAMKRFCKVMIRGKMGEFSADVFNQAKVRLASIKSRLSTKN